jgi:mannose-6-phosphate isomerase-like protein (cupin superfamily)
MRHSILGGLAALALGPTAAAASEAPIPLVDAGQIKAMVAHAKATIKPGQPTLVQPLLNFPGYTENLEYRQGVGVSAVHETEDELFYVIDGSGLLQTGGDVVEAKRVGAHDINGTALKGAQSRIVAKGDFLVVPHRTPHWFSRIDGALVLMSLHVPAVTSGAP